MYKKVFLLWSLILCCGILMAQESQKSALHQRAEAEGQKGNVGTSRYYYIQAFEDYAKKGQLRQGVECGVKATAMYYKANSYKEAFDLLRYIDQTISAGKPKAEQAAALHYLTTKERMQMYMKLHKGESVKDQMKAMEAYAAAAHDEDVSNDLLYNKALFYYTYGQNAKGNAVFKEMAEKLTGKKEYDKVDEVYQTLIANGRRSNNASLVAQSYQSYMAWKDSVSAMKVADEIGALKQQIAAHEASIADKDSSLSTRQMFIIGLGVLVIALLCALALGAVVLLRYIMQTRKQKKTIAMLNENNALKAQFISNISAQMAPTLQKLDGRIPEVKALQDFSDHVQTLSSLENSTEAVELEETQIQQFCEALMDQIRNKVKPGVTLVVNVPKTSAMIHRDYVSHILLHLLNNAAEYTPQAGKITLDYKKRSAHSHQFLVTDTGQTIPEEQREAIFKPFVEVRDLTTGDGLGLPICKQMALKMDGDLEIDGAFTKGTRFVLNLQV